MPSCGRSEFPQPGLMFSCKQSAPPSRSISLYLVHHGLVDFLCCSRASSTFGLAVTAKPQTTTSALPPRSRVPSTMACIFHYQYRLLSPDNHSWSRQANRAGRNGAHQLRNRSNQSPSRHISKSASPSIPPSLKPTQYPLPVT